MRLGRGGTRLAAAAAVVAVGVGVAVAAAPVLRFRFERPVTPGAAGPNRLEPDAALLARARPLEYAGPADAAAATSPGDAPAGMAAVADGAVGRAAAADGAAGGAGWAASASWRGGLGDLRLFDAAGAEVPYLLVAPRAGAPEWRRGRVLAIPATKAASGCEVDLGAAQAVDSLRLSGLPAPFLKRLRLEGSGDRSRWTELAGEGTLFDLPAERLTRTAIDFPAGAYRYLRVTWDDATSGRLPLPGAAEARLARAEVGAPPAAFCVLAVTRLASAPGESRFRLRLPGGGLPVAAVDLDVPGDGPLLRAATVTEGRLDGGRIVPEPLGRATLRRAARGGVTAADLRIPIARPRGSDLEVVVSDGSNPPLALAGARAELAPLPWIYFEAASTAPLTARFGDAAAGPPSYDLEARRERAGLAATAAARWGEVSALAPAVPAGLPPADASALGTVPGAPPVPQVGAPVDMSSFRVARAIHPGPAVLLALPLDAAVLAHSASGDLADLRIVDGAGRQVPYVLERLDEPLAVDLGEPRRQARPGDPAGVSRYTLRLPYATLPAARLVVTTSARAFERTVRLFGTVDETTAGRAPASGEPPLLATQAWSNADAETAAPALSLDLPAAVGQQVDLLIDEGDNAALPLVAARLLLPAYRLRYFPPAPAADLELLYGQPRLGPPRYDLSLFTARLLGDAAQETSLSPEPAQDEMARAESRSRTLFWVVLAAAVVALLGLLGRLLRAGPPPGTGTPPGGAGTPPGGAGTPPGDAGTPPGGVGTDDAAAPGGTTPS